MLFGHFSPPIWYLRYSLAVYLWCQCKSSTCIFDHLMCHWFGVMQNHLLNANEIERKGTKMCKMNLSENNRMKFIFIICILFTNYHLSLSRAHLQENMLHFIWFDHGILSYTKLTKNFLVELQSRARLTHYKWVNTENTIAYLSCNGL